MPTIVIHALTKAPQKANFKQEKIRIGREPANDLVLSGDTVSREHAALQQDPSGRWAISCVSATNPIVVDGALTSSNAFVSEGTEILLGTEYLLIFSMDEYTANSYMGDKSYFSKSECDNCHWKGMVSTLRRKPVCPRCGGTELSSETVYKKEASAGGSASQASTTAVDPRQVKAMLSKLKTAKRSRLERIDGKGDGPTRKELSEDASVQIAKGTTGQFRLLGLAFGKGVTISWNGSRFMAESAMLFPGMKINGEKTKETYLSNGDIIEVGSNRFRFVTE